MKLAGVYDQVEAAVGKVLEAENINLKNKGANIWKCAPRNGGENPHRRIRP